MLGTHVRTKRQPCAVTSLDWSPDGRFIASGSGQQVTIWEVVKGKRARSFLPDTIIDPKTLVSAVAFSPDGAQLAIGAKSDRQVTIWDVATGMRRLTYVGHTALLTRADSTKRIWRIAWLPDDRHIVSQSRELHVWDRLTGATCWSTTDLTGPFACSPDGSLILTYETEWLLVRDSERGDIGPKNTRGWERRTLRDAQTGEELRLLPPDAYPCDWMPDGRHFLQKQLCTISICDSCSGAIVHAWKTPRAINQMALSPDGAVVATSGSSDPGYYGVCVSLWETHTGRLIVEEQWHKSLAADDVSVAWSPDSTQIAVGGLDKCVRVWRRPASSLPSGS